jgi:hemoglobin-like flavoprotein
VELLESSFKLLAPRGEELVELFYDRLFETAPSVRELFPDDLAGQRKALLGALGALVSSLRKPEQLTAYLEELGASHVGYGAADGHYDVVAQVLLEVMAELAGDEVWNDDLQTAWSDALTAVKGIMLGGAEAAAESEATAEAA